MEICKSSECFGCSLCADICPLKAISIDDSNGFYRPHINEDKCIKCGKCLRLCPSNTLNAIPPINVDTTCFAAYSKDEDVHYECTSGGIATELSKEFIRRGGFVVGAWWNTETQKVEHRVCDRLEDVHLLSKSKYVLSCMTDIYEEIESRVPKQECLFIGVSCQVNAVRRYFENKSGIIHYIDLLCRGGASPKCLSQHLQRVSKKHLINNITFRGGSFDCNLMVYTTPNKVLYRGPQYIDPYFWTFMEHVLFQKRCYECPFAGKQRLGDITLGDFWGLENELIPSKGGHGVNMVFVNNEDGEKLLRLIMDRLVLIKRSAKEAIDGNDTLREPTPKPDEYEKLWKRINSDGFIRSLDIYSKYEYEKRYLKSLYYEKKIGLIKVVNKLLNRGGYDLNVVFLSPNLWQLEIAEEVA